MFSFCQCHFIRLTEIFCQPLCWKSEKNETRFLFSYNRCASIISIQKVRLIGLLSQYLQFGSETLCGICFRYMWQIKSWFLPPQCNAFWHIISKYCHYAWSSSCFPSYWEIRVTVYCYNLKIWPCLLQVRYILEGIGLIVGTLACSLGSKMLFF